MPWPCKASCNRRAKDLLGLFPDGRRRIGPRAPIMLLLQLLRRLGGLEVLSRRPLSSCFRVALSDLLSKSRSSVYPLIAAGMALPRAGTSLAEGGCASEGPQYSHRPQTGPQRCSPLPVLANPQGGFVAGSSAVSSGAGNSPLATLLFSTCCSRTDRGTLVASCNGTCLTWPGRRSWEG